MPRGPEPPAQFSSGCLGKLRESLREAQLAAGARPPPPAAAVQPVSPPLSLPGPGTEVAVEVSPPGSWGAARVESTGRFTVPGRPALPGVPSAPKRNGSRPEQ